MSLTMFDSINVLEIPLDAQAVAGYVNGRWPTYLTLATRFPKAHRLSIAVDAFHDADCLDIESGDATVAQAPAWVKRQLARDVVRPVIYTSVSNAQSVIRVLAINGIPRGKYRLWTAHYSSEHLCSPKCGFGFRDYADATQWTSNAEGRNLDQSLCANWFFPAPPAPKKPLLTKAQLRALILRWRKRGVTWARIKATKAWRRFRALGGR